jgi:hypothetical protein
MTGKLSSSNFSPILRLFIRIDLEKSNAVLFLIRVRLTGISISCDALTHFGLEKPFLVKFILSLLLDVKDLLAIGDKYKFLGDPESSLSLGNRLSIYSYNILVYFIINKINSTEKDVCT